MHEVQEACEDHPDGRLRAGVGVLPLMVCIVWLSAESTAGHGTTLGGAVECAVPAQLSVEEKVWCQA